MTGGLLLVTPLVESKDSQRLRYEVVSSRQGGSGTSETRQSGELDVGCCKPVPISRLGLSLGPQDRYLVSVKLFAGGRLVAEASASYP